MSKRIGLPVTLKMRHDAHYVESLTTFSGAAVGRMIPVDKVRPNPDQPRKALGDLHELTESIKEKGVREPLLVRFMPREDTYYIHFRRAPLPFSRATPAMQGSAVHRENRRRR